MGGKDYGFVQEYLIIEYEYSSYIFFLSSSKLFWFI